MSKTSPFIKLIKFVEQNQHNHSTFLLQWYLHALGRESLTHHQKLIGMPKQVERAAVWDMPCSHKAIVKHSVAGGCWSSHNFTIATDPHCQRTFHCQMQHMKLHLTQFLPLSKSKPYPWEICCSDFFFNKVLHISGISAFFRIVFLIIRHELLSFIKTIFSEGWFVWVWFNMISLVKVDILWMSQPPQRIPLIYRSIELALHQVALVLQAWKHGFYGRMEFPVSNKIALMAGLPRTSLSRPRKLPDQRRVCWMQHRIPETFSIYKLTKI